MALYIFLPIILIILILLLSCIKVVPQANAYVIEFLGSYKSTWEHGLHLKIPFVERIAGKISLKEQVCDFAPSNVITKDNVSMKIDTVVYFKIFDPRLYTYGVDRPISALENLNATTLRNIIGGMELDQTLTSRDIINSQMQQILDIATDAWGISAWSSTAAWAAGACGRRSRPASSGRRCPGVRGADGKGGSHK